ncbi:MAG: hypothetical protein L0332_09975 [Chloroflexi bacterium]|nr:hypothetical protein [Chloroflexota bacterium]MCI0578876.1 hypothetical protein [Chloroflexota bacterium]MCI0649117.1 hypothetical protein [Chloroflexota bacterium]MCI0727032.1 hypothetical protein [Chloroflexota bacterium]
MATSADVLPQRHRSFWQRLTFDRLVTAIVFIALFTMAVRVLADTDIWWHLQSGRWMVEHQAVPRHDPFSHTRFGQRWIDHGWLAQLLLWLLFDAFSYAGPALFVSLMVTLAFYFVWLQCRDGDRWLRAFTLILAAVTSAGIWAARPQIVSFTLASVAAYLLYRYKQEDQRAIWGLPLVVLLWVNVHGGFAIAFILMVAYLFGEVGNQLLGLEDGIGWRRIGRLALAIIVCLLVVPLNPNGVRMWAYPFQTAGIGVLQDFIAEWRSPNFHELYFQPFIWLLLAALAALGLSGRQADFTDLTLVALFTYLTLLAARNIALFALVTAPVVVRYGTLALTGWRERVFRAQPPGGSQPLGGYLALNWLLLALVLLAALVRISQPISAAANEAAQAESLPVAAVAYLRQVNPPGPLFNSYNWGGYVIWALPQYPVYVDGRTDLYGDDFLRDDYLAVILGQDGWQETLDEYGVNLLLIEPETPLARLAAGEPGWRPVYEDEMAVVIVRVE